MAVGVLPSGVFFTAKVARLLTVEKTGDDRLTYRVAGQVFFASADRLVEAFDVRDIEGRPPQHCSTEAGMSRWQKSMTL